MDGFSLMSQVQQLCLFLIHMIEELSLSADVAKRTIGAMRFQFELNFRETKAFDSPILARARQGTTKRGREASIANQKKRRLPVTYDMILWIKQHYYSDMDKRMIYLGISLAFHFAFRASEYIMNQRNEHAIRCEDVEFLLTTGERVPPYSVLSHHTTVTAALIVVRTSKKAQSIGRYLYVTRNTVCESELVDELIRWSIESGIQNGDPFLSRHKDGKRRVLTSSSVTTAIKAMAEAHGLDSAYFATHSLRIGGITTMNSQGNDREATKRIAGFSSNSNVDALYTLNTPLDGGTYAHIDLDVGSRLLDANQVRLMCPSSVSRH
jgi:hypothetical protein